MERVIYAFPGRMVFIKKPILALPWHVVESDFGYSVADNGMTYDLLLLYSVDISIL